MPLRKPIIYRLLSDLQYCGRDVVPFGFQGFRALGSVRPLIPISGIPQIALDPVQMGMYPSADPVVLILGQLVSPIPIIINDVP